MRGNPRCPSQNPSPCWHRSSALFCFTGDLLNRLVLATHVLKMGFLSNVSANSIFLDLLTFRSGVLDFDFDLRDLAFVFADLALTDFPLEDALRVFAPFLADPIIL